MEHEEEFLTLYFSHLSHFCFDKAREHVEKEREACRAVQLTPWVMLITHLPQIALAEKSYIDLGCLHSKNKGFLRKDNSLRAIYDGLRSEMRRLEDVFKVSQNSTEQTDKNQKPLTQHIVEFLTARIDLIDLYERVYQLSNSKQIKYGVLFSQIELISNKISTTFTHSSITPMKAVVSLECEILLHLIAALDKLQSLQFLPSLVSLYSAHTRLSTWESSLQNREVSWKLGFSASFLKNNPLPLLFQWLVKLKQGILSKFSLYFYNILSQQTTSNEMRQLLAKQQIDYYHKLTSFQRRYDVVVISLISYDPNANVEENIDTLSIVVSCPPRPQKFHLKNIETILSKRASDLINSDRIIYSNLSQEQCVYVLTSIESQIYMVMVFDSKKSEKDTYISNFMNDICLQLKCSKIFSSLKNSSK